jgi:hypothetical protein
MPRQITASLRREIERQETGEVVLAFLTITHRDLAETIRVVSDGVDYVWQGERYIGFPFDSQLLSDGDAPPKAQLVLENVDERIGQTLRRLRGPARLRMDAVAASWFDETVSPRVPLGAEPVADYTADHLFLTNVSGDALQLTGDIRSYDYVQETWPAVRATENRLPGLFK